MGGGGVEELIWDDTLCLGDAGFNDQEDFVKSMKGTIDAGSIPIPAALPSHPCHLQRKGLIQTRQPCTVGTSNSVSSGRPCGQASRHTFCPFPPASQVTLDWGFQMPSFLSDNPHWIIIHLYSFCTCSKGTISFLQVQ